MPTSEVKIRLSAASQPKVYRPQLQALKNEAKRQGISLSKVLARRAAKLPRDGVATQPNASVDDLSFQHLEDLKQISKDAGVRFEEGIDRYGWQETDVFDKMAKVAPAQYVGAEILNNSSAVRFSFKGEIPGRAVQLAKRLPVAVEFVGNKGYSEAELVREHQRATQRLPAGVDSTSHYDINTGVISIVARPKAATPLKAGQKAALRARLTPSRPANPNIKFRVAISDTPLGQELAYYLRGGGFITSGPTCTTGFNIYKGRYRSPSSAGHCVRGLRANVTYYQTPHGVAGTRRLARRIRHEGRFGDFGRYTAGSGTTTRTFWYALRRSAYVNGVASRAATNVRGRYLCSFGWKTHNTCSRVLYWDARWDVGGVHLRSLVIVDRNINRGGDSGGPYHRNNIAYGLVSVRWCTQDRPGHCNRFYSAFSPTYNVPRALDGWRVWTR